MKGSWVVFVLVLAGGVGRAQTAAFSQYAVVPSAWELAEAPSSSTLPFGASSGLGRYQQVYDAADLAALPVPCWVTAVSFRPNQNAALTARSFQGSVRVSSPNFGPDSLSTTFALNVGADEIEALAGGWAFGDAAAGGGPAPFAWRIDFAKPFRYEGKGILLDLTIDATTNGGSQGASLDAVNVASDPVSRMSNSSSSTASKGTASSLGLVTRFDYVAWTPLYLSPGSFSAAAGGKATLWLDAGSANAGRSYLVLGSFSGTSPGWAAESVQVPLNFDRLTWVLWNGSSWPYFQNFSGSLDAAGKAEASIDWPGPMNPFFVGKSLDFAFVLTNPVDWVSNPVSLTVLP